MKKSELGRAPATDVRTYSPRVFRTPGRIERWGVGRWQCAAGSNNTRIYLARTATTGSRTDNAYEKTASWAERRQPTSGPIRRVYFARLAESSAGVSADGSVHRCKMKASARPICGLQNASIHRQRPFQRAVEPHL